MQCSFGVIVIAYLVLVPCLGHVYNFGKCPTVQPQSKFEMDKFLGMWYVIEKTSTSSECVRYNFTKTDDGHLQIEQTMKVLTNTPIRYIGDLEVPEPGVPSLMRVKFPLNYGSAKYIILWTDYEAAVIFSCQELPKSHRQSLSILSRKSTLDKEYYDKIMKKIDSSAHLDKFELSIVSHDDCPRVFDSPVTIDSETISTKSFASVIRKGGEKIGDLFEYTADKVKSIFGNSGDDTLNHKPVEPSSKEKYELVQKLENDAEWVYRTF